MANLDTIDIYVRLLEEGTPTIRSTKAVVLGKGFFKLLPTDHYDPEDEVWEFLPGDTVSARPSKIGSDEIVLLASPQITTKEPLLTKYLDRKIESVFIVERSSLKQTQAINLGNGLYVLLPTDGYDPQIEDWEFSPGAIVRVIRRVDDEGNSFLLAFDQIREDRMNEEYAQYVLND